jgi:hypothetical protein
MVAADAQNIGLALPQALRPDDAWINGRAENCQECYELRYRHFKLSTAVPL